MDGFSHIFEEYLTFDFWRSQMKCFRFVRRQDHASIAASICD